MAVNKWKDHLHHHGLRLYTTKMEYMATRLEVDDCSTIHLHGIAITRVEEFKYLGSVLNSHGDIDLDVKARIAYRWLKWWECSKVLCDTNMLT